MSYLLIIPIFAGWLAGLLVNYLADVLPRTRSLSQPVCVKCNEQLSVREYVFLRPCKNGHARGPRFWVVQALGMLASVHIWLTPPERLGYPLALLLIAYLGLVFIIDLEHRLILHMTSLFGIALGATVGFLAHGATASLLGGAGGLGLMMMFYLFGLLFARYRARRMSAAGQEPDDEEALGAGDVILVTILGLILGWPLIWFGLLFGILLGGLISFMIVIWLFISRQYNRNALMLFIPYGIYFIVSAYLIMFLPQWVSLIVPK